MVFRVYVEKRPGFDIEASHLADELRSILGVRELERLRVINRYDVEGVERELFERCVPTVFSEPPVDIVWRSLDEARTGAGAPADVHEPPLSLIHI